MRRYNWHSAVSLGWPFPMLKYKYIFFKYNRRKQFYQTVLGNLYALKLAKCWFSFEIYCAIYYNFRQTFVPCTTAAFDSAHNAKHDTVPTPKHFNGSLLLSAYHEGVPWLDSRVVSVVDSSAEWSGLKSQSRRCRVTVLGKLFTPIVPVFTKQQNW